MDWQQEVRELHDFFESWFLGRSTDIGRFRAVLDRRFTIVGPTGMVDDRDATLAAVESARGHTTDLRIEVTDLDEISIGDDLVVGRYVETHHLRDRSNQRWSTVVFRVDPSAPNGVRWMTVHETWRPPPVDDALEPDG